MQRRAFIKNLAVLGIFLPWAGKSWSAGQPFDLVSLRQGWLIHLKAVAASGKIPLIDIESSYNPGKLDVAEFIRQMDEAGVALSALSPEIGEGGFREGKLWHDGSRNLVMSHPAYFIPTTTSGIYPAWTEKPGEFLTEHFRRASEDGYPLLGEFEFRHYISPRQWKRGQTYRDVSIQLNGEHGHRLFAYAEKTGIPFQIHYEIEDGLLPALEEMLTAYPKAKVIWCHLAQIRYSERSRRYGPAYLRGLLEKHPNLYIDTAFGGPDSIYPGSGEAHARVWRQDGTVSPEWVALISDHPWRFLAALDIGGDRMNEVREKEGTLRRFLGALPEQVCRIVAYKAAWKLLFDEVVDV